MNVATKLGSYAAVLAVLAGGAWFAGNAAGPIESTAAPKAGKAAAPGGHAGMGGSGGGSGGAHGGAGSAGAPMAELPGGLAAARGGYTLVPTSSTLHAGKQESFAFRIIGPDGKPVTSYQREHEKLLHLIVIRRDTSAFQHVHPRLGRDGSWTVPLDTSRPGSYRAFADFTPTGGTGRTLGVDLTVAGDFQPVEHPESRVDTVDGYEVRLDGTLTPGATSELTLSVATNDGPVGTLQPYLGAYGHLVALRGGDLAYLHVHPDGTPGDGRTKPGPKITFFAEVPTAGTYRLFLDFKHEGVVRTAEFTVTTGKGKTAGAPGHQEPAGEHGHR